MCVYSVMVRLVRKFSLVAAMGEILRQFGVFIRWRKNVQYVPHWQNVLYPIFGRAFLHFLEVFCFLHPVE